MSSSSKSCSGPIGAQRTRTVVPVEKVVYVLWRRPGDSVSDFAHRLLHEVATELVDLGVAGLQVNVADDAVASAMVRLVELDPQMEAVLSIWIDTVMDSVRRPIEEVLDTVASKAE